MIRRRLRTSHARISLRAALADPALLGNVLAGESWAAWRTLLIAAMGEALTDDERGVFRELTHRDHEPGQRVEEFVGVIGRRGGKSRAISALATYLAGLCQHPNLVPGERGLVLCIAPDIDQATIVLDYVEANFRQSPLLRQLVESRTRWQLKLVNKIDIEVRASDFRRLRGPTYVAVIADESAFWLSDNSSNPDSEILNSVRPGLATTHGPLFLISSPYARKGELWRLYQQHFGPAGDPLLLVAQAPSRTMNPTLRQSVVDRASERDPASAAAEYGAQFRTDVESFVSLEAVRACISLGVYERAPERGISYSAFADPSGGSSDSFTLAIGHINHAKQTIVIDAIREQKPPFSPEQTVEEFSRLLKDYRVSKIVADRYGGAWVIEQFGKFGSLCEQAAKPKSDLYLDALALLNSRRLDLLDHARLTAQLTGLERRSVRGGRDVVDHPPGGHDDLANCVAGLASVLLAKGSYNVEAMGGDWPDDPVPISEYRRRRHPQFDDAEYERITRPVGRVA
jgi:hypothetical protein